MWFIYLQDIITISKYDNKEIREIFFFVFDNFRREFSSYEYSNKSARITTLKTDYVLNIAYISFTNITAKDAHFDNKYIFSGDRGQNIKKLKLIKQKKVQYSFIRRRNQS